MAVGDNKFYVVVATVDPITGIGGSVKLAVGSNTDGLQAVAIVGGNYNPSDPWVLALMKQITGQRQF
jgi:hypothetical protein